MSEENNLNFYINRYLTFYKNDFSKIWKDEKFKWQAVKCFQDNWDINATDFIKMLDNSFAETYNLLSSNNYFPLKMIKLYAEKDPLKVRAMFLDLYNEDKDIVERITNFKNNSEYLCNIYTPNYQHYQKENAITVYLWLKYPDKYYIFKFGEIKSTAEKLHSKYHFIKGAYENNIRNHIKLYDSICNILQKDIKLKTLFYSYLDDTCYKDSCLKTLTIDFGYFIAKNNFKIETENIIENNKSQSQVPIQSLNQILYGPPGTGKTYNTVIKAMEIINETKYDSIDDDKYQELKKQFDGLKKQGQIEFVTFHQSYSYEEFVEGIKPDLENGKELRYKLQNGIFKTICNNAKELLETKVTYNFNKDNISVYKILIPDESLFAYCIENGCVAINWGNDIDISDCDSQEEIVAKIPEDFESRKQCISQLNLFKLWIDNDLKSGKDVIVVIPGSMNTIKGIAKITGDYFYNSDIENGHQQRKVDWIRKNINISSDSIYNSKFVSPTITGMFNDKINWDTFLNLINNKNNSKSSNAVLVIDEINRGNISKIFGELITLIEEDKRETLSVKLPYSQDDFTVPTNLYIIGTMNTSDRSIASIDIALRRRFKFVEMMPRPELVADFGCGFQSIFDKLNTKIKILLDRDHQIGHSYFINTKYANADTNILKEIWFSEIIPLLNEYFYCDWEKLKLVIPGFIKEITIPEELKNDCEDSMYEFKTPNEVKDFVDALKQDKFKQED